MQQKRESGTFGPEPLMQQVMKSESLAPDPSCSRKKAQKQDAGACCNEAFELYPRPGALQCWGCDRHDIGFTVYSEGSLGTAAADLEDARAEEEARAAAGRNRVDVQLRRLNRHACSACKA